MSATLGDSSFFSKQLTGLTGAPTTLVQSEQRPVPLEFEYSTTQLQEKVAELNEQGRSPVYLVHFTQNAIADTARDLLSTNFCTKEEKQANARAATRTSSEPGFLPTQVESDEGILGQHFSLKSLSNRATVHRK